MDRICVLRRLEERDLTQREAGDELGLSVRQIRRLYKRLKQSGPPGVKRLPQGGNRGFSEDFKTQVMDIVKKSYYDFGPTFASEKLLERNGLSVNRETLRQWMMEEGFWKGRARKRARVHQSRERRPRFGEMTQADGSHHAWFEDRGPKCCLIVMIDVKSRRRRSGICGGFCFASNSTAALWPIILTSTAFLRQLGIRGRMVEYVTLSFTEL
jgi:hypothetical protein